jgi:hypothetical protein
MSAPVKNTCPDIDKAINCVKAAIKAARDGRKEYPEADDCFWDILYNIEDLVGQLEDLRSDNSALRLWGHELDEQLREAAQQIVDLENQLEERVNA